MRHGEISGAWHLITGMHNASATTSPFPQVPTSFDAAQWLEWSAYNRVALRAGRCCWQAGVLLTPPYLPDSFREPADRAGRAHRRLRARRSPGDVGCCSIALNTRGAGGRSVGAVGEAETTYRESLAPRQQRAARGHARDRPGPQHCPGSMGGWLKRWGSGPKPRPPTARAWRSCGSNGSGSGTRPRLSGPQHSLNNVGGWPKRWGSGPRQSLYQTGINTVSSSGLSFS